MTTESASRSIKPHPPLTPNGNQRGAQSTDDRPLTPGQRARARIKELGLTEPPARSIDEIPDWVLGGG